ncbi:TMEM165/GDT1 family protein [Hyphococcus lacteus]|uniref:GDT1 family protein n=1 Tax=Hyphococcus lacteus TaxID=3143536 RepID=A0ABV3Z5C2_9PROT
MTAFLSVFITVFLAELGDKTQLATVLFASEDGKSKWMVFFAAAAALTLSTAAAVLAGAAADRFVSALPLKLIAGAGFILIGTLMVIEHFRAV